MRYLIAYERWYLRHFVYIIEFFLNQQDSYDTSHLLVFRVARCESEVRNSTFPNPRSGDRKFWKLSESLLIHHYLFFTSVTWLTCSTRGKKSAISLALPAISINWREDILLPKLIWLKPTVNVPLSLVNVTSCYAVRSTGKTKVIIFMLLYHSAVVVLTLFIVVGTAIFNHTTYGWSNCSKS